MCGEHISARPSSVLNRGSSPHVRGARTRRTNSTTTSGIIPACAGSTLSAVSSHQPRRDHPRMCGEHNPVVNTATGSAGSSPHVRGAHRCRYRQRHCEGIIPACAGSTRIVSSQFQRIWDHPRMCGEHPVSTPLGVMVAGSSPHVRGALIGVKRVDGASGIIPACAGSTRFCRPCRPCCRDHPRMCGEHYLCHTRYCAVPGSSPHVRGALRLHYPRVGSMGIIPACAGSTITVTFSKIDVRDHPRMCGEHWPLNLIFM